MKDDCRVPIKTFNGTSVAPKDIEQRENFWVLIGKAGTIIDDKLSGDFFSHDGLPRMLVRFDGDLDDFGLENHNRSINGLWIKTTDLKPIV